VRRISALLLAFMLLPWPAEAWQTLVDGLVGSIVGIPRVTALAVTTVGGDVVAVAGGFGQGRRLGMPHLPLTAPRPASQDRWVTALLEHGARNGHQEYRAPIHRARRLTAAARVQTRVLGHPCNVPGTWLSTPRIFLSLRSPNPIG
jgi:hypothetical protein